MFSADPSTLQHIPLSEYAKRRAYWVLWKKANGKGGPKAHPTIPGVTIEEHSDLEDGVNIIGE